MEQLQKNVQRLAWLAEQRNVKVGNVYILGMKNFGKMAEGSPSGGRPVPVGPAGKAWIESNNQTLKTAGLGNYEMISSDRLFNRLDVKYSPTWVVRHLGRDYVFEGYTDPARLFNKDGEFIGDQ